MHMKIVGLVGLAGIVGGGLYMHGPIGGGEVYPLPAAEALQRVQSVELPGRVEGMLYEAGRGGGVVERAVVPGKSVIFTFKVQGKTVGSYTVTADPVDAASSRIGMDFVMAPDAEENMKGVMMPMAKQFAVVGKAMVDESVDAALDGRPYDKRIDRNAMMEYTAANPGEIMKGASDAMDAAAALSDDMKQSSATAHPKYDYGSGAQPRFEPGKPMVNPGSH